MNPRLHRAGRKPAFAPLPAMLMLVLMPFLASSADARTLPSAVTSVQYTAPKNPTHKPLYDKLKSERWLEHMQATLGYYRLPRPLTLKLDNCDGEVDAWFHRRTVAVCYAYLQVVMRRIDSGQLPAWVTPNQALAGAFVDAFLHEFGHALFEAHRIPLLGREEDAADQFSSFTMLHLGGTDASGLIKGTAQLYLSWIHYYRGRTRAPLGTGASQREARAHPTAAQRLYNIACLALGSNAKIYARLARAIELPESRAEDCGDEYKQLARAWRTLIAPHVDKEQAESARSAFAFFAGKR